MDKLPPEILTQVIENLGDDEYHKKGTLVRCDAKWRTIKLALYSTISRAWNASIERLIFRSLAVTTDELGTLETAFSGENVLRRRFLETLTVTFILPDPPNGMSCCDAGQIVDREADSSAFSASVVELFSLLADLDARVNDAPTLSLSFQSAHRRSKFLDMERRKPLYTDCKEKDYYKHHSPIEQEDIEAVSGCFKLVNPDAVPAIRRVVKLDFKGMGDLKDLSPTWISDVARRLPEVEKLCLGWADLYEWGRHKRRAHRRDLSWSIRSLTGDHLREVTLDINHNPILNEALPVHRFVNRARRGRESWYGMLRKLSSFPCLRILRLHGGVVVCPEFFRGIIDHDHAKTTFPALVELDIQFAPETADGRWFYDRDDEAISASRNDPKYEEFWERKDKEDERQRDYLETYSDGRINPDEDYVHVYGDGPLTTELAIHDRCRSLPSRTTFLPFLLDAAKAASRIPKLQKFILKLERRWSSYSDLDYFPVVSRVFELWYLKSGTPRSLYNAASLGYWKKFPHVLKDVDYLHLNRLYWRVDRWVPWDEVQSVWGTIAGPEAKVVFLEEKHWKLEGGRGSNDLFRVYDGNF